MSARGGDEKRLQIGTAKARHRRAARRQRQLSQQLATRRKTQQALAFEHRHPVSTLGVDRRAIGPTAIARQRLPVSAKRELLEDPAPRQTAIATVEIESVHSMGLGVGPVHRRAIGTKGQAIAGRDAIGHALDPTV